MSKKLKHIKNAGFTTPKDYFEGVEDAVFGKLGAKNLLDQVDTPGFSMPEDYLDSVEDQVMTKLDSDNTTKVISLFNRRNLFYASGVAAVVFILFSIFINREPDQESLDYEVVENYIINQNINSFELATLLTEEELFSLDMEIMDEAFEEGVMEDYLLENINLEEIIEQ